MPTRQSGTTGSAVRWISSITVTTITVRLFTSVISKVAEGHCDLPVDEDLVYAVLHYDGAPSGAPTTDEDDDPSNVLQEHQLAALEDPGSPGGNVPADRVFDLSYSRDTGGGTRVRHLK
jgi:hypothetical protein